MLGQGKNVWQAEIDAAAEVSRSIYMYTNHDNKSYRCLHGGCLDTALRLPEIRSSIR